MLNLSPFAGGTVPPAVRTSDGFSLILALLLLAFILSLALLFPALLALHLKASASHRDKAQARLNAILSERIALGYLQQFVGRDCTATAGTGREGDPLVAIFGDGETMQSVALDSRALARNGGDWICEGNNGTGRFAFSVNDESQKIAVCPADFEEPGAPAKTQMRRQLCMQRHEIEGVFPVIRADLARWQNGVAAAGSRKNLELAWLHGGSSDDVFPLSPKTFTPESLGVLSDAATGGLRVNWDQDAPLPAEELPCSQKTWDAFFRPDISSPAFAAAPEVGLPVSAAGTEFALRRFPILSALHIRFGFFNARSDGYHRTRFTCDVQLWNPFPFPLYCTNAARLALLDFEKMPAVKITNCDTGAVVVADMGAFPIGQFGGAKQTVSDATANAYLDFSDKRKFGMPAPGLLAGEVFNFSMPNPKTQPQGFSRVLSATTWKMQTDPKKAAKPPSGVKGENWFHAAHKIEIRGTMPAGGITLHLREARGNLPANMPTKDYSPPVLTLKNVLWKDFFLQLDGNGYNRAKSSDYSTAEARIALSLKLKNDSPESVATLLETIDPRAPVLDFSDPNVTDLFTIRTDAVEGLNMPLAASRDEHFLWASAKNSHGELDAGDSFSEMRVADFPTARPISVASLRHLPREGKSAGALNQKYPRGREEDARWFDRAFFAGAQRRNPWLVPNQTNVHPENADIAAHCFVRGSFNVNCTNAEAWRVALARALPAWKRKSGTPAGNESQAPLPLKNVLFRLPFGAAEPRKLGAPICDFDDAALRAGDAATGARAFGMQGFRALEPETRDRLASALAEKIRAHRRDKGAFRSLAEFALSDVLFDAIQEAGCNSPAVLGETPPAYSPLRLNAGDILESLLPALAVRGDTFAVRITGGVALPLSPNKMITQAHTEIVVQRFPEFFDNSQPAAARPSELNTPNKIFGRRLKIVWRQTLRVSEE